MFQLRKNGVWKNVMANVHVQFDIKFYSKSCNNFDADSLCCPY